MLSRRKFLKSTGGTAAAIAIADSAVGSTLSATANPIVGATAGVDVASKSKAGVYVFDGTCWQAVAPAHGSPTESIEPIAEIPRGAQCIIDNPSVLDDINDPVPGDLCFAQNDSPPIKYVVAERQFLDEPCMVDRPQASIGDIGVVLGEAG